MVFVPTMLARPRRPSEPGEDEPWWFLLVVIVVVVGVGLSVLVGGTGVIGAVPLASDVTIGVLCAES